MGFSLKSNREKKTDIKGDIGKNQSSAPFLIYTRGFALKLTEIVEFSPTDPAFPQAFNLGDIG